MTVRAIVRPIVRPIGRLIVGGVAAFSPLELFNGGALGGFYDPSDITSLWQDSARTTPVTAYGQPVGAIDDKSGNARHLLQATAAARPTYAGSTLTNTGSDLVTNGTFAADATWAKGAGWTIASGVGTATASSAAITEAITVVAGRLYKIVYTVTAFTGGSVTPQFTGGTTTSGPSVAATGTYTVYLRAEAGNTTLGFLAAAATLSIDNVSVFEQAHAGYPGLLFDGADDALVESSTHTLSIPAYACFAMSKFNQDVLGFGGSGANATNMFGFINVSTNDRVSGTLRSTARGTASATCGNTQWPVNTIAILDTLSIIGTTDVRVNNNTLVSAANTWIAGDTVAAAKLRLSGTVSGVASSMRFHGGVVLIGRDPGANWRAAMRRWLGRKVGVVL